MKNLRKTLTQKNHIKTRAQHVIAAAQKRDGKVKSIVANVFGKYQGENCIFLLAMRNHER